jgi:hypothetical protein
VDFSHAHHHGIIIKSWLRMENGSKTELGVLFEGKPSS